MVMCPSVTYIPCSTSSRGKTGDILTFTQFEEGRILTKTYNDAESGDESDNESIIPLLLSEEETDAMVFGNESDHDLIYMEMLEKSMTEVSLIGVLTKESTVIKYVIILGKCNCNGKDI